MKDASTADGRGPFDARALLRAAGEGDAARVESLLAAGADVNAAAEGGETALLRAASKGRLQVVRTLLKAGADPNAEREDGFTALGVAVFFGYADIVRELLAGGADPTAKGRLGTTAEQWARFSGFTEIVELLRNPEAAAAQSSAGDGGADAPVLFPTEGSFNAVVPLSQIDESSSSAGGTAADADESTGSRRELREQEVATLVRPRPARATLPARSGGGHRRGARRSWPVTLAALCLSVLAGLAAGTYLIRSRRSAQRPQPAPAAAVTVPSPAAAVATPSPADDATPTPEPQPTATTTPAPRQPPPAPRPPEETTLSRAAQPPPPVVAVDKPDGVRREAGAGRRTRRPERRAPAPAPLTASLPVSTPTPPAQPGKSKVIKWP